MKYMLAIKRDNNDYLPLEWNVLKEYAGEDLSSLEGIDNFTSRFMLCDLVDAVILNNLVDKDEKYSSFVILYNEKGKNRELKEGVLFSDKIELLDVRKFCTNILNHCLDKQFLNKIDNILGKFRECKEVLTFQKVIKDPVSYLAKDADYLFQGLMLVGEIPYEIRRKIMISVYEKVMNN